MSRLTAAKIKSLSQPGKYGDGNGLYLRVALGGSKSWIQRVTIAGKRRDIGLGGFPTVSLARARQLTADNRSSIAEGRNPLVEKRKSEVPTFREAAEQVLYLRTPTWRSPKTANQWRRSLEKHAFPILGRLPVNEVTSGHVLQVLTPIWTSNPEVARKTRQRILTIMQLALGNGWVDKNPAGEILDGVLPKLPRLVKGHFRSLPYAEVPFALEVVAASRSSEVVKQCLQWVVLTACRSSEARLATWDEINLDDLLWEIPKERMKAARPHRVPLSAQTVEILDKAQVLDDGSGLIFPSPMRIGKPLSNMTLLKVLRDAGLSDRTVVHGFRSSFRTWCLEQTDVPWAVAESALAHNLGDATEIAYVRTDLFQRRVELMADWGSFVGGRHG